MPTIYKLYPALNLHFILSTKITSGKVSWKADNQAVSDKWRQWCFFIMLSVAIYPLIGYICYEHFALGSSMFFHMTTFLFFFPMPEVRPHFLHRDFSRSE